MLVRQQSILRPASKPANLGLGMHGNQPSILEQGAALYGKALRQLGARINDKRTCYDHENVSATMALHLYEVGLD